MPKRPTKSTSQSRPAEIGAEVFRRLTNDYRHGVGISTVDSKLLYANDALLKLLAIPAGAQLQQYSFFDFLPETEAQRVRAECMPALEERGAWSGEVTLRALSGERRQTLHNILLFRDEQGAPTALATIIEDITALKMDQAALEIQQTAMDSAITAMAIAAPDGKIIYVNRAFANLWRLERPEDALGRSPVDFAERPEDATNIIAALFAEGHWHGRLRARFRDGNRAELMISAAMARSAGGDALCMIASFIDLTAELSLTEELRATTARLEEAQRIALVGSWELDLHRDRLFCSDEMFRLLEIGPTSFGANYQALLAIMPAADAVTFDRAYKASLADRQPAETRHRLLMADGRVKHIHQRWHTDFDASGNPVRTVGAMQDVTSSHRALETIQALNADLERRIAERTTKLTRANEEAEQTNRANTEFLSHMSHELRSRLNAVLGYAQLLELDQRLPVEALANVAEIGRAGDRLLALANDVLDWVRVDAGRKDARIEDVDLGAVLTECRAHNAAAADQRRVDLVQDSSCEGIALRADHALLTRILDSLLSTAVKYAPAGGRVTVTCAPGDVGRTRIDITDSGGGISAELQSQLFQPFNRLSAERGQVQGAGIGLFMAQRLAQQLDGAIGVDSTPGERSTLWLELPASDLYTLRHADSTETPASNPRRVLIAEDYGPNLQLLKLQIQTLGYDVDVAEDGRAALAAWQQHRHTIIVTDVHMPGMDGMMLTKTIRQLEHATGGRRTVIIGLTGATETAVSVGCRQAGMDHVLTKPLDLESMRRQLANAASGSATHRPPPELAPATPAAPLWDLGQLYAMWGDVADSQVRDIVTTFATSAAEGLAPLLGSRANFDDVARELHKQKSTARAAGALRYAALAAQIETGAKGGDAGAVAAGLKTLNALLPEVLAAATAQLNVPRQQRAAAATTSPVPDLELTSVLIVDDDPLVLQQTAGWFHTLRAKEVLTASSGSEALSMMATHRGGLETLVLDLTMPGMDGVELMRAAVASGFRGRLILSSGQDTKVQAAVGTLAKRHGLNYVGQLQKPATLDQLRVLLATSTTRVENRARSATGALSADLIRSGLAGQEITAWFQPIVNSANLQAVGAEALARWRRPDGTSIPPDAFIPAAERFGLIAEVSQAVVRQALEVVGNLTRAGFPLHLSLNVSGLWLTVLDFPDFLMDAAENHGLRPTDLTIEVTETGVMEDVTTALDVLTRLRLKGFSLSIDDFGIGYSSFEQLARIPFTEMKLDRSFVSRGSNDAAARAILEASMDMARKLQLTTVAEGVETAATLELVRKLGCNRVQGFLIAEPMPPEKLASWLKWR